MKQFLDFSEWLNGQITQRLDWIIKQISELLSSMMPDQQMKERVPNYAFHLFIVLVNLVMSLPNIILFLTSDSDIHTDFWLGTTPRYLNVSVPLIMLFLNISFWTMTGLSVSFRFVSWFIFVAFAVVALVMNIAAIIVFVITLDAVDSLWYNCGADPLTAEIQTTWDSLAKFQVEGIEEHGDRCLYIQNCPGFGKFRKNHTKTIDYMEDIELDYSCQGFCTTWTRPLFDPENTGEPCAAEIGGTVLWSGILIAGPATISGILTFWIGQCLARYKHI
jgi:hypothetical protein